MEMNPKLVKLGGIIVGGTIFSVIGFKIFEALFFCMETCVGVPNAPLKFSNSTIGSIGTISGFIIGSLIVYFATPSGTKNSEEITQT